MDPRYRGLAWHSRHGRQVGGRSGMKDKIGPLAVFPFDAAAAKVSTN
jgi:hypothetical protein